ncbi:hypothetical protein E2C01_088801 [Portunus trituberculatus]|uniref:Uncharacterized protein n=1 Tax=Portunus trituberculatus TaxID=210409 RepID=A0A5B7JMW0_PORTR|nr:hypothetical protein [Portunus trituberculatus]
MEQPTSSPAGHWRPPRPAGAGRRWSGRAGWPGGSAARSGGEAPCPMTEKKNMPALFTEISHTANENRVILVPMFTNW